MSRSIPVTAGTPPNDLASCCSRMAPPVTGAGPRSGRYRHRGGPRNRLGEPGEVGGEPVDIVRVVLNRQQPLLHLPPWREKHTAIVLHEPVQVAESGINFEEVPKLANPVAAECHAALGADGHHVPAEAVSLDHGVQR